MKIRNGFVSNSSSSSFVVRGIKMNAKKFWKILGVKIDEYGIEETDGENDCEMSADCHDIVGDKLDLQMYQAEDDANIYVGDTQSIYNGEIVELDEDNTKIDAKIRKALDKYPAFVQSKIRTYVCGESSC